MIRFLTPTGKLGASSRYRVYQYEKIFKCSNLEYEINEFMSDKNYENWKNGNFVKVFVRFIEMFLRRIVYVVKIKKGDTVFIHRDILPFGPMLMERYLKWKGCKIIIDIDDSVYSTDIESISTKKNRILYKMKYGKRFNTSFKLADKIICGNKYLKNYVENFNDNLIIIPTTIDTEITKEIFSVKDKKNEILNLGWIGNPGNTKYVAEVVPIINKIAKDTNKRICLTLVGANNKIIESIKERENLEIIYYKWSLEKEYDYLRSCDIGIMPLPDEEWSKGKCGLKALQYMSIGIPAMVSSVGENTTIVKEGLNGYLVYGKEEWETKIKSIILNKDYKNNMAEYCKEYIEQNYSVNKWGSILVNEIINV